MTTPPPGGVGPVIRRTVNPAMITSDFESKSHEQLRAMIENADPSKTQELGDKLKAAGVAIGKIGDDLQKYMSHVNWEGEAGDAFRTWGANMVSATARLGEFSEKTGTWMGHAAETLGSVKSSMPAYSAASKTTLNDYLSHHPGGFLLKPPTSSDAPKPGGGVLAGPTPEAAAAAQKRLDEDHAEAVRLMRKLAGSYVWSAHHMGQVERPVFQPIPPDVVPPPLGDIERIPAPGSAVSPGLAAGGDEVGQGTREVGTGQATYAAGSSAYGSATSTVTGPAHPESAPAAMEVDGGVAAPTIPTEPSGGATVPTRIERSPDRVQLPPAPGLPPVGPAGSLEPGATAARGPGRSRASTSSGMPMEGVVGGSAPRRGAFGDVPGQGIFGGRVNAPTAVPNDGIVGGRPLPRTAGQPSLQAPRGTVIGAEPGTARPPMGHGLGGVMPGPSAGRTGPGQAGGRRLASESGGIVGGHAQQRAAGAGGRPFTPGGTGLVRNQGDTPRSRGPRQRQGERRPDYLVEDRDLWQQGARPVVPPVID